MKTAAIYNRWLFTLGGGEQVTFAYAEALRDLGYRTYLLTHKQVDLTAAERKMNVDLKNIEIVYLPHVSNRELSNYSSNYDVFINTSYLDYFPNMSKNGFLSVFFPGEIYLNPWEFCKRYILLPSFKNFFIYPTMFEGFTGDEYRNGNIYKWLGTNSTIFLSSNSIHNLAVELYLPTFNFSSIEKLTFKSNNQNIIPTSHRYVQTRNSVVFSFTTQTAIKKFTIEQDSQKLDKIALLKLTIPNIRYVFYNIFKSYFPKWEMRLHGGPSVTTLGDLQSYKKVITISNFCQFWIQKYWNLPSEVLYPPVNTKAFTPGQEKKNWITHIGRFFVTGHSKKQLELIRVFKDLVDKKLIDNTWELHFIGSIHEGKNHQDYFENCVSEAGDYPIHFHIGIPFNKLKEILEQSKIYWHATGLDQDPNKQPILMEHFGITTVEAMAAGCVPIVINRGGQPEIITRDSGYVWNTREELKSFTTQITRDDELRKKFMKSAVQRSAYFSITAFKDRFRKIIEDTKV